jgi:TonB family protein
MKRNNWFVPAIITIGLVLIIMSIWSPKIISVSSLRTDGLARLIEKTGVVAFINNEIQTETEIKTKNFKFDALDIIRTSESSEALIEFKNGSQFRLAEKSEVVLDLLDNGQAIVVIRTGEIFIEKFGEDAGFWIRSDGQLYSASDYVLVEKNSGTRLKKSIPDQKNREQLSQVEIESVLNSKRADFFKCYGQLLQRKPLANGEVLISFTVERSGQTTKIEISKSSIEDKTFNNCLTEVVSRARFRSFFGSPVATVFPLKFE